MDDAFKDQMLMKGILREAGYEVEVASNGAMALDMLSCRHFDLVLLDIKMSAVTGYDLIKLFEQHLDKKVKVIFVSVTPRKELEAEANGFVQKPFSKESLLKEVERVINS